MTSEHFLPVYKNQSVSLTLKTPAEKTGTERDKTLVLMAHDFPGDQAGNADLFLQLEQALLAAGYPTLRFDFRGCGKSFGKPEQFTLGSAIKDFRSILSWAFREGYEYFIYIGEGLGGAVCMETTDLDVKAMVLFWPVLDLPGYNQMIRRQARFHADEKFWDWNGRKVGSVLMEELAIRKNLQDLYDAFMPVLIFQGAQDKTVPASNVRTAQKHMASKRLECTIFHQGEHGLSSPAQREAIAKGLIEFLNKNT